MAEGSSRTRQGRPTPPIEERPVPIEVEIADPPRIETAHRDHTHGYPQADDGRTFGQAGDGRGFSPVEEWMILADRRMERLEAKIDRLGEAVDQFNGQLHTLLTDMPTRSGINLYLVGGLVGGLAVGLAIMGITIGGLVGGLTSLRPEPAQQSGPSYAPPPQAPIIIQMPSGQMPLGPLPSGAIVSPSAPVPASPSALTAPASGH